MAEPFADDVIEELLRRLEEGEGLNSICADKRMPDRRTIQRWQKADDDLAQRVMESREIGYFTRAEKAVEAAKSATGDANLARLAFDAERWHLSKLSNAFADKPLAIGAFVNVDAGDAFAAIADALQEAADARAGLAHSTRAVVIENSSPGPADAPRKLADLAGAGRAGVGQDSDGR